MWLGPTSVAIFPLAALGQTIHSDKSPLIIVTLRSTGGNISHQGKLVNIHTQTTLFSNIVIDTFCPLIVLD